MAILITGASGFIGQHLVNYLLSKNEKVCCIVRSSNKLSHITPNKNLCIIKSQFYEEDIVNKIPFPIDTIIHLIGMLGDWGKSDALIAETNIEITKKTLALFTEMACGHFIYISTPGVQGFGKKKATETDLYNPRHEYERTKQKAEELIINYPFSPNQKWTILRPDFVYGPGDIRRLKLYRQIKKKLWIGIGDGNSYIRPTYVIDVCRAIYCCYKNKIIKSDIFNVAGPELVTINEYIDTIADALNVKLLPLRLPTWSLILLAAFFEHISKIENKPPIIKKSQVEFLTQDHGTDISKIERVLNFTPKYSLQKGIEKTIKWAIENRYL